MRKKTGHGGTHKDMKKRFKINELLSGFLTFSFYEFVYLFIYLYLIRFPPCQTGFSIKCVQHISLLSIENMVWCV